MAKVVLNIEIDTFFISEKCKCSTCFECKETIFSNEYRLCFLIGLKEDKEIIESDSVFCASCKNLI